jgi:hypothetical protein
MENISNGQCVEKHKMSGNLFRVTFGGGFNAIFNESLEQGQMFVIHLPDGSDGSIVLDSVKFSEVDS